MSLHRRNPKRDANEAAIVDALTSFGFHVTRISGRGVPDLLLSARGQQWIAEVKTKRGQPTADQLLFTIAWRGSEIPIFHTVDEAITWARALWKATI